MRNLSLLASETASLGADVEISATTLDLDHNVLYVASESQNADADVEVEIWKIEKLDDKAQVNLI